MEIPSGILFFSYCFNLSIKPISIITVFADAQSVFSCNKMHTASNTIYTAGGGATNPLIVAISPLLIVKSASSASFNAGKATLSYY